MFFCYRNGAPFIDSTLAARYHSTAVDLGLVDEEGSEANAFSGINDVKPIQSLETEHYNALIRRFLW